MCLCSLCCLIPLILPDEEDLCGSISLALVNLKLERHMLQAFIIDVNLCCIIANNFATQRMLFFLFVVPFLGRTLKGQCLYQLGYLVFPVKYLYLTYI
jgi:hypothetical protein